MASQITSLTVINSTVYSDADQRKHQISASLAFVWGIHRDRWIPRTKSQLRGKCFHLMMSSWMGSFSGWWEEPAQYLTLPFENIGQGSVIIDSHFHGFAFKLHISHKSGFCVRWIFAYRRCDNHDNVQFMKSWEKYATSFDAGLT